MSEKQFNYFNIINDLFVEMIIKLITNLLTSLMIILILLQLSKFLNKIHFYTLSLGEVILGYQVVIENCEQNFFFYD